MGLSWWRFLKVRCVCGASFGALWWRRLKYSASHQCHLDAGCAAQSRSDARRPSTTGKTQSMSAAPRTGDGIGDKRVVVWGNRVCTRERKQDKSERGAERRRTMLGGSKEKGTKERQKERREGKAPAQRVRVNGGREEGLAVFLHPLITPCPGQPHLLPSSRALRAPQNLFRIFSTREMPHAHTGTPLTSRRRLSHIDVTSFSARRSVSAPPVGAPRSPRAGERLPPATPGAAERLTPMSRATSRLRQGRRRGRDDRVTPKQISGECKRRGKAAPQNLSLVAERKNT